MTMRRVVTGFGPDGESVFVADDQLAEVNQLNTVLSSIWRTDGEGLHLPPAKDVDDRFGFPVPGGAWVMSWTVPPHSVAGEDQSGATVPGELPSGGAHATDSI